jgi:hypothetical protein
VRPFVDFPAFALLIRSSSSVSRLLYLPSPEAMKTIEAWTMVIYYGDCAGLIWLYGSENEGKVEAV